MGFLEQHMIHPSPDYLTLLRYLLVMVSLIHFPYIGMVVCATAISVIFNMRDRDIANPMFGRAARDLMEIVVPNRVVPLVFGVLPLVAICMIYGQWLYESGAHMVWLLPVGALVVALAFGPLTAYRDTLYPEGRNSFVNFSLGGLSVAVLLVGTYCVIGAITRFQDPERWFIDRNVIRHLTSFNIIWRYSLFIVTGLAATGCAMLFFLFTWPGAKPIDDEAYARMMKNFGAGIAIVALFLVPVMLFFYVVTTPILAMSGNLFALAVAVTAVLFVAFVFLYFSLIGTRARFGGTAFMLFLIVFLLLSVGDQLTLVNATKEHTASLVTKWEEEEARRQLEREAEMSGGARPDAAKGEEVFNSLCSTCHRMDERLVGPPLNTVLPKYAGNPAGLVEFISNPTKVNQDYPPMPKPALSLAEIRSVVLYLTGEDPTTGAESSPGH